MPETKKDTTATAAKKDDAATPVKKAVTKTPATAAKTTTPVTPKVSKKEMLEKYVSMVQFVQNLLNECEMDIKRMKLVLGQLTKFDLENMATLEVANKEEVMGGQELKSYEEDNAEVVEGKFDGYFMIASDQKKYPVPLNYSSKTKLVPGDILKLKIMDDGKFVYKLISPIERRHLKALLSKTEDNKYIAISDDGKTYFLNQAAVTFFKGKPGDELYILTNAKEDGGFAAIEAIIKK